jgi:hypothetical protein
MAQKNEPMGKRGRPVKANGGRVNVVVSKEVHQQLVRFSGEEFDVGQAANGLLGWLLSQREQFLLAVMHRKRAVCGDEALRRAFCSVLTDFKNEVCAEPNGQPERRTFLDHSDAPAPANPHHVR